MSCDKNHDKDNTQLESKQIVLVNDTSGTELAAGTVRINELINGRECSNGNYAERFLPRK